MLSGAGDDDVAIPPDVGAHFHPEAEGGVVDGEMVVDVRSPPEPAAEAAGVLVVIEAELELEPPEDPMSAAVLDLVVEQDSSLRQSDIYNVYARRPAATARHGCVQPCGGGARPCAGRDRLS